MRSVIGLSVLARAHQKKEFDDHHVAACGDKWGGDRFGVGGGRRILEEGQRNGLDMGGRGVGPVIGAELTGETEVNLAPGV